MSAQSWATELLTELLRWDFFFGFSLDKYGFGPENGVYSQWNSHFSWRDNDQQNQTGFRGLAYIFRHTQLENDRYLKYLRCETSIQGQFGSKSSEVGPRFPLGQSQPIFFPKDAICHPHNQRMVEIKNSARAYRFVIQYLFVIHWFIVFPCWPVKFAISWGLYAGYARLQTSDHRRDGIDDIPPILFRFPTLLSNLGKW